MSITHAAIVPLIGGLPLGMEKAFGTPPDYLLSYSPFSNNDSHIVNYWKDTPYILLDRGGRHPHWVDVVGATCPCAGLSSLSPSAKADSEINDWMLITTNYVLGEMKPKVFWGENAPRFTGEMGKPIVNKLHKVAKDNGYTMSIYRTKSLLHGLSQVRERSFYFFWKDTKVPIFKFYDEPRISIEAAITSVSKNSTQQDVTNHKTPSIDDPYYRYVLEVMSDGMTHVKFQSNLKKSTDAMHYIEQNGHDYMMVKSFFKKCGYEKLASKMDFIQNKLNSGGNIMRRSSYIPKDYIGAFVGHLPTSMTHPYEDRYLTYRECMTIMGLPQDFELLNASKNLNHVCQNVPVTTASHMAMEIQAVLENKRDTIIGDLLYQYNPQKRYELKITEPPPSLECFI